MNREQVRVSGLLAGPLLVACGCLGGAPPWALVVGGLACLVGAVAGARLRLFHWGGLSWGLLFLAVWTWGATWPWPAQLLEVVAPHNVALKRPVALLLGDQTDFLAPALEVGAARQEAWRLAVYAWYAAFVAGAARRHGVATVFAAVTVTALSMELLSLAHVLADAERVYGLYAPLAAAFVGPIMNLNTLAGVLSLGAFSALWLYCFSARSAAARLCAGACFAALCAGTLWCGSRAATGAFFVGVVGHEGVRAFRRARGRPGAGAPLVGAMLSLGVGILLVVPGWERIRSQLVDTSVLKWRLHRSALEAIFDFAWWGAGRGGFSSALGSHAPDADGVVFEYAENWLVEAGLAWGVPCTIVLLCASAWWLCGAWRARPERFGWIGLAVWTVQNLFDLGSELFGPGVLGLSCLAALTARAPTAEKWKCGGRCWELGVVLLVFVAPFTVYEPARRARASVAASLVVTEGGAVIDERRVLRAVREHPADPFLRRAVAWTLMESRDPAAFKWINVALERNPQDGKTLLLLAVALREAGAVDQAGGALRRALENSPELVVRGARLAAEWYGDGAIDFAPEGRRGAEFLKRLSALQTSQTQRVLILNEAHQRDAQRQDILLALLEQAVTLEDEQCQGLWASSCANFVRDELTRLRPSPGRSVLESRLLWRAGDERGALSILIEACPREPSGVACLKHAVSYAADLDTAALIQAGDLLVAAGCGERKRCADLEQWLAAAFQKQNNLKLALKHAQRAARELPSRANLERVEALADALERRSPR